jgi:hypothetical protein
MIQPQRTQRTQRRLAFAFFSALFAFFAVQNGFAEPTTLPTTLPAAAFQIVGHIDAPEIPESSGIVASRKYPGIFWTHNDSGNPAQVFAIDRTGKLIASFSVAAKNIDWEDIAVDEEGHLYLADIGDNNCKRYEIQVYRVDEPAPHAAKGKRDALRVDTTWRLKYPAKPADAESLFLLGGNGYLISKFLDGRPAGLYRFSLTPSAKPVTLEKVLDLPIRAPVTAADLSRDGKWLAVMTLLGPFVYRMDGDVKNLGNGPVWQALFVDPNIEGLCFPLDGGLLATTEGRRVIQFHWHPPQDDSK